MGEVGSGPVISDSRREYISVESAHTLATGVCGQNRLELKAEVRFQLPKTM